MKNYIAHGSINDYSIEIDFRMEATASYDDAWAAAAKIISAVGGGNSGWVSEPESEDEAAS